MISIVSSALSAVQLASALARLDSGSGSAQVRVYGTVSQPVGGDVPMSTIQLPKPCGVVSGSQLTLAVADAALVMTAGMPRWAELVAADGVVLHIGDVTDAAHDGFYRVSGADTQDGETSPYFSAGGLLSLGSVVFS